MKTKNEKPALPTAAEIMKVLGLSAQEFENLALDIWQNFPEASYGSSLKCMGYDYKNWVYKFLPEDKPVGANAHNILRTDKAKCLSAVAAFIAMKLQGQLKGIQVSDFTDASEYDAEAADAIAQIAVLGEVIYG